MFCVQDVTPTARVGLWKRSIRSRALPINQKGSRAKRRGNPKRAGKKIGIKNRKPTFGSALKCEELTTPVLTTRKKPNNVKINNSV